MTRKQRLQKKRREAELRFGFLVFMSPFVIALAAIAMQIGQAHVIR